MSEPDRRDILLRAAYDLIRRGHDQPYLYPEAAHIPVYYDEARCGGLCLMEDIAAVLDIPTNTPPHPLPPDEDQPG